MSVREEAKQIQAIVDKIKPHLAGHPPEVQGAVIADLMAIWLAGHAPELREPVMNFHMDMVRQLIEPEEGILFGDAGHPARSEGNG